MTTVVNSLKITKLFNLISVHLTAMLFIKIVQWNNIFMQIHEDEASLFLKEVSKEIMF